MCKWSLVRPFWRKGKVMNTGIWIIFCTSYDSCFYVLAFNEMCCRKVWNKVLLHLYNFDNTIYLASLFLGNINTFLEIFLLENNNNNINKQIITVDCLMWYHTICTTSGKVQKVEKCICSFFSLSHDSPRAVRPPPWIHYVVQYTDMCRNVECKWRETFSKYRSQASNNARLAVGLSQNTSGQRLFRDW